LSRFRCWTTPLRSWTRRNFLNPLPLTRGP
jgi:hypothetical protein